jgi:hypothetical protein
MKQLMVVGIKVPDDGNMEMLEIDLVEPITVRSKMGVETIQKMVSENKDVLTTLKNNMLQQKQYRHKIYISRDWCSSNNITMFTGMTLDFEKGRL